MNILVLSPHRDDAAFSLSLAIDSWLAARHTVTLLNCFTRSLYAPFSDADFVHQNDRLSYVSAMRRKEDEAFARHLPHANARNLRLVDLNLKDAPIRLRCADDDVCNLPVNPADPAIPKIARSLEKQIAAGTDAIVLPLALGHHVDHRTVREATLPLAQSLPCAFYEDLPYALRPGVSVDLEAHDVATSLEDPLTPVTVASLAPAEAAALKRRLVLLYASQIDSDEGERISSFCLRYHGAERLWANPSWLHLAQHTYLSKLQTTTETEANPLPA